MVLTMNSNKYKLIVLFGKAGAGKDYLLQQIYERHKDILNLIVSDTTRPPRFGEENGKDYYFLTEEEFKSKEHLEQSYFNNWYYGTPLSSFDKTKINICVMNPEGIKQIYLKEDLDIKLFYISAPDITRFFRQIEREQYPNFSEICRRYLADEEDYKNLFHYPFTELRNSFSFDAEQCIMTVEETINQFKSDLDRMN